MMFFYFFKHAKYISKYRLSPPNPPFPNRPLEKFNIIAIHQASYDAHY